ncbi:MAG: hypothetical protein O8C67_10735 [Candidatus Methanoperedens sp.]|nr:hypothetical protein [Candidatus Methanoperedens sp.]
MTRSRLIDQYPPGPKNCLDCKNFRIKLKISKSSWRNTTGKQRIVFEGALARCVCGYIVREANKSTEIICPTFKFDSVMWKKINEGWRHFDWNMANRCMDFVSMEDDE